MDKQILKIYNLLTTVLIGIYSVGLAIFTISLVVNVYKGNLSIGELGQAIIYMFMASFWIAIGFSFKFLIKNLINDIVKSAKNRKYATIVMVLSIINIVFQILINFLSQTPIFANFQAYIFSLMIFAFGTYSYFAFGENK